MPLENVLPQPADTLLEILSLGHFQFQARDLTQHLMYIDESEQLERDVNGILIDIADPAFRKFETVITASDKRPPPFENLWPGMPVTIYCASLLCYLNGNSGSPCRPAVPGSTYTIGHYTFYRPILNCLVRRPDVEFSKEWSNPSHGWTLKASEE